MLIVCSFVRLFVCLLFYFMCRELFYGTVLYRSTVGQFCPTEIISIHDWKVKDQAAALQTIRYSSIRAITVQYARKSSSTLDPRLDSLTE
jgi:hypothetical protein